MTKREQVEFDKWWVIRNAPPEENTLYGYAKAGFCAGVAAERERTRTVVETAKKMQSAYGSYEAGLAWARADAAEADRDEYAHTIQQCYGVQARLREEVESAQLDRDAWKRRGEELEAKLAAIAAGTVEHLDDVPSKAELKTDTTSLGREIVAGLTDFADHLEQGGKADNYKAKPEPSGDAADILLWLRFERAAGYHTSRYGTAIDVIESQSATIAEQAKEIEGLKARVAKLKADIF